MFLANVICLDMTLFHDYPPCLPYGIYLLPLMTLVREQVSVFQFQKVKMSNEVTICNNRNINDVYVSHTFRHIAQSHFN